MILTEFDPIKKAVINPSDFINPVEGMPKVAVTCYANTTFKGPHCHDCIGTCNEDIKFKTPHEKH